MMNAEDLSNYSRMLDRREKLKHFIRRSAAADWLMVKIPSPLERELGRESEGGDGIFILDDKAAIRDIAAIAATAAVAELRQIEGDLRAAGITYDP